MTLSEGTKTLLWKQKRRGVLFVEHKHRESNCQETGFSEQANRQHPTINFPGRLQPVPGSRWLIVSLARFLFSLFPNYRESGTGQNTQVYQQKHFSACISILLPSTGDQKLKASLKVKNLG